MFWKGGRMEGREVGSFLNISSPRREDYSLDLPGQYLTILSWIQSLNRKRIICMIAASPSFQLTDLPSW